MRNIRFTLLLLALTVTLTAQVTDTTKTENWGNDFERMRNEAFKEFEQFKSNAQTEFDNFRRQANEEYARFMEEAWKSFKVQTGEEIPWEKPKPVQPFASEEAPVTNSQIMYDEEDVSSYNRVNLSDFDASPQMVDRPEPLEQITPAFETGIMEQVLLLYGSPIPFRMEKQKKPFTLKSVTEKNVANAWKKLSTTYYDNIVAECLQKRNERDLCDWAYVKLTQNAAEKYCGVGTNEAVLLQMYLLTQSGYQMRMAQAGNRLALLMGSKEKIYRYNYTTIGGLKYYVLDKSLENKSMKIFDRAFPSEKAVSLAMHQPKLSVSKTKKRTVTSKRYPELSVTVETNKNLIDFYNEYPISGQWNYYSMASVSDVVKESLFPELRRVIKGKNELDAVNILLNFVQSGFEYKTDDEQFGYERPLYPDETFYYPYSDCEDRSILFSCLVRELVGLDVVLLHYPGHLSTAVRFNQGATGDYLTVDGKNYYICDPTSSCPACKCPKKLKTVKPKVVRF